MNNLRFSSALALILASVMTTACSESPSTPTSSSSASGSLALTAEQIGGTWILTSMQPAGEAEQATPAGARYDFTFADGRVSARTDCNVCSTVGSVSGQTLTVGSQMACTRAACPTMAFENVYTAILAGESYALASGATLTLSSKRGVLRFTR